MCGGGGVRTQAVLQRVFVVTLLASAAAAQTYTVPDEGQSAQKCMYRLRLKGGRG
jgi:hypothetical protein